MKELLIEVNNWLGFDELEVLFSILMAIGLNIRFKDTEKSMHITSAQMANAKQCVCSQKLSNEHSQY